MRPLRTPAPFRPARYAALSLLLAVLPVQAGLYKWVDAQGNVTYGDRPPADPRAGHVLYNTQGVAVETKPAALSAEQRVAAEQAARTAREAAALEARKKHHDRVLLETFTTERDLLLARDDRLGALDAAIALSSKHHGNWQNKLARVTAHIADIETNGQSTPTLLIEERDSLRRKISGAEDFTAQKMQERSELANQFNADINRYRALKLEQAKLMRELAGE